MTDFAYADGFPSWFKTTSGHMKRLALLVELSWPGGGGRNTLDERLSEVRKQSGVVAAEGMRRWTGTLLKPPCLRGMRAIPWHTLAVALQLRKDHGETSVREGEKCHLRTIQLVN
jgi:hypothetical protein